MKPLLDYLTEIAHCLKLADENPFKIKAFERAIATLEEMLADRPDLDLRTMAQANELTQIKGVGAGISETIREFLLDHSTATLDELKNKIPPALFALTQVSGLGAKKARVLVDQLGIGSLSELAYACSENRLVHVPGFGEKSQEKIKKEVDFLLRCQGRARWDQVDDWVKNCAAFLGDFARARYFWSGEYAEAEEIISELVLELHPEFAQTLRRQLSEFLMQSPCPVKLRIDDVGLTADASWAEVQFRKTSGSEFLSALPISNVDPVVARDWPAYLRKTSAILHLTDRAKWLSDWKGTHSLSPLTGIFHFHTRASDGNHSLAEMVETAVGLGFSYVGVSDHSQTAFYAQGLKIEALIEQAAEVAALQKKWGQQIKIFRGIESDILENGALDYPEEVLAQFDFVIASVHSRFGMDASAMTERLLNAVANPFTRFLGHLTGRILLGRAGYALDFAAVFAACAKRGVAVELNASPSRMDVSLAEHAEALKSAGCFISIHPDAHDRADLSDVQYGILQARKAFFPREKVLNAQSLAIVEAWLKERR